MPVMNNSRYEELSTHGDPLERLNAVIDWKIFRRLIDQAFKRERKSAAGRKPYHRLMMFKVWVLQQLYSLSISYMYSIYLSDKFLYHKCFSFNFNSGCCVN
jgi:hypothetical protein